MSDSASTRNVEHKSDHAPTLAAREESAADAVASSLRTVAEDDTTADDKERASRGLRLVRGGRGRHRA